MEKSKVKKILLSVASLALIAVMVMVGTVAYLQDESKEVENTFKPNSVEVELTESVDHDKFNIVPGTSETKDPKVTVTATLPAWVYVKITDETEGLVSYDIEDGWTQLDGYSDVYYRSYDPKDEKNKFDVLKGNKVSYDAALTNEDMKKIEDGKKAALTFQAYAIQKTNGDNSTFTAEEGWLQIPVKKKFEGNDAAKFAETVKNAAANEVIALTENIEVTTLPLSTSGTTNIDLGEKTLKVSGATAGVELEGKGLSITNGTFEWNSTAKDSVAVAVKSNGELTLDNVILNTTSTINVEAGTDPATINIIDSTINSSDYYCVSTNAADSATGKNVVINIEDSTLSTEEKVDAKCDSTPILFNIPGKLSIKNSIITGERHAVIVRCGTATIENSELINKATFTGNHTNYDNATWGSGNEVPVAALVVGNRSDASAYPYDTTCTLSNTTLTLGNNSNRTPIYAAAYNGHTTTINGATEGSYTTSCGADSKIIINGEQVTN